MSKATLMPTAWSRDRHNVARGDKKVFLPDLE
jgi:hypothetical protein